MPVSAVFENLEAGATIDEIVEQFDLTREQIKAVLEFAARSLDAAGPAQRQSAATDRRQTAVAVQIRQRQRAGADLGEPAGTVAVGDNAVKGQIVCLRVDGAVGCVDREGIVEAETVGAAWNIPPLSVTVPVPTDDPIRWVPCVTASVPAEIVVPPP